MEEELLVFFPPINMYANEIIQIGPAIIKKACKFWQIIIIINIITAATITEIKADAERIPTACQTLF